ncbi:Nif3-like dinuclear metal center hexameric protein [Garciella nitratireducens]|uniref:Nif3-like dinuclear metal center hexameric protein n=1 Tax=Garciella nitratireducens TaxID=218205 RepID=UPI001BD52E51
MSIKCQNVMNIIEKLAPKILAEDWDNVGLQVGDPRADIEKILICLDLTEEVLKEAIQEKANMIITHHPFIFKPLKNIRMDLSSGNIIKQLIKKEINLYTAHTNLDIAENGLNDMLAEKLSLKYIETLFPIRQEKLFKIVVFVPKGYEDKIRDAMGKQGAGWIGNYSNCTFQTLGTGTFKPLNGTNPFIGSMGKIEKVEEVRIETIVTQKNIFKTLNAIIKVHPYEEVAYDIYPLENQGKKYGLGRIGEYEQFISYEEFLSILKSTLKIKHLRIAGVRKEFIKKVALCTGSGAEYMNRAAMLGADIFITGDLKYHEAQQAKNLNMTVIDAGHFATESIVMEGLKKYLDKEFIGMKKNIDIIVSKVNRDFIQWE